MATWLEAEVREVVRETPSAATLKLDVPGWRGHTAGQHVDVRLTAEDGYTAQRSYSISSAPEDGPPAITVERLDDGEVSPYLVDEAQPGDQLEVRGPVGGWFVWLASRGGPLFLVAGGSGLVAAHVDAAPPAQLAGSDVDGAAAAVGAAAAGRALRGRAADARRRGRDDLHARGAGGLDRLTRAASTARMLAEVAFPPEARAWTFVCGPTGFVEGVAEDLVALGHHASSGSGPSASAPREGDHGRRRELRLDGNAAAGMLDEIFRVEATTALATCAGCGATRRDGGGARLRPRARASCCAARAATGVVMRFARIRGRLVADMRGVRDVMF